MGIAKGVYNRRRPQKSAFYQLIRRHFDEFRQVYEQRFEGQYGYHRAVVTEVLEKYLGCGNPTNGFARVRCEKCNYEYLLTFSCKCRYFCPSCHQKRLLIMGEFLKEQVLLPVAHRQIVWTLPKMLRVYFRNHRALLGKLSRCAYSTLKELYQTVLQRDDVLPGAFIAVHTFGELINFHPHLHALVSDGCFGAGGKFYRLPMLPSKKIEQLFAHKVFRMLLDEGLIKEELVKKISSFRHSGFSVHQEIRIAADDKQGLEGLIQYILRAPVSLEKMLVRDNSKVIYHSSRLNPSLGRNFEVFDPLEWIAALTVHIPDKGEHMLRYYGYYSNKSRGMRAKRGTACPTSRLIVQELDDALKSYRRRWSYFIRKVYEVDPLICPSCGGKMQIVGFCQEQTVVDELLRELGIDKDYEEHAHAPPAPLLEETIEELVYEPVYE